MSPDSWKERLLDILLEETLCGDTPPDVTSKVLRKTKGKEKARSLFNRIPVAAAAGLLLVAATLLCWPKPHRQKYPSPTVKWGCHVQGGDAEGRNALLTTTDTPGGVALGGYVDVTLGTDTALQIRGREGEEEVQLQQGRILCEVAEGRGRFTVRTEFGNVLVLGTKFTVEIKNEEEDMNMRQMVVKVLAGVVLLAAPGETGQLVHAGEERAAGDRGRGRRGGGQTRGGWGNWGGRGDWQNMINRFMGNGEDEQEEPSKQQALEIYQNALQARMDKIKEKAFVDEKVATALATALKAARKIEETLAARPEVKQLEEARKAAEEERNNVQRPTDFRNRDQWRAYGEQVRDMQRKVREVDNQLAELTDNDPALIKLREEAEAAWIAFLEAYTAALEAQPEYKPLSEELAEADKWISEIHQEERRERRNEWEQRRKAREERERKAREEVAPDPAKGEGEF